MMDLLKPTYTLIKVAQNFSAFWNQIKNSQTFPEEQKKTQIYSNYIIYSVKNMW